MAHVFKGRFTAGMDEPFVLFIIGMKVHRPWAVWQWAPVFGQMPKMLNELYAHPEKGFLGAQMFLSPTQPVLLQYWRDFDLLIAYANDKKSKHFPAWAAFNRKAAYNGAVGVWHETYKIEPSQHEGIYVNMPLWGLGRGQGAEHVVAQGPLSSARGRMTTD